MMQWGREKITPTQSPPAPEPLSRSSKVEYKTYFPSLDLNETFLQNLCALILLPPLLLSCFSKPPLPPPLPSKVLKMMITNQYLGWPRPPGECKTGGTLLRQHTSDALLSKVLAIHRILS